MNNSTSVAKYYLYIINKETGFSHLADISNSKKEIDNTIEMWKKIKLDKHFKFIIQKNY